jgi:hypothetical protein
MKGWMYILSNGSIDFKDQAFLDSCPEFFSYNRENMLWAGRFDTEDIPLMYQVFLNLKMVDPKNHEIALLCKRLNFDFKRVQDYANSIRQK